MNKKTFKTTVLLVVITLTTISSCTRVSEKSKAFTVRISDKPQTFCNPLGIVVGSERARRLGEPVVVLHQNDYYLFTGGGGYWCSDNMRDWNYISAPDFPRGCPSVISDGEKLIASGDKGRHDVFASTDPKSGKWTKVGEYQRDYGDADMFLDDDGRYYMYWGWSQVLPFQGVELDPENGFKEKGEPVTLFFGDYESHGFERRRNKDVIFPYFNHRPYFPEESPWIEGPWMIKHNGKYYLQYAAIGLEFASYSHGIYLAHNPLGPFEYSPHNPLTFKTTGFMVGAGHGSTFHDKNGQLWTICMVPSSYGGGRGSSELALFPTAVDAEGVMHSNTAFGDYPQYYPGIKKDAVDNNFAGWMLLSNKKYVEVTSTLEGFNAANAVDENFRTFWCAETGDPGEYMTIDLGKECHIYALQVNFDQHGVNRPAPRGFGFGGGGGLDRYQSYTIEVSNDNKDWSMLVDKSNNTQDLRHDYTELAEPVKARYVKLTNVFTHDEGKFAVKDFRVFGNPDAATFTKVKDVTVVRDPEDPRDATILWQPVEGADGYVVQYGIEPDKLYNNYMIYDGYTMTIHSLNRDEKYYFEVEAFDSGTDYYKERTEQTMGRGAEIELTQGGGAGIGFARGEMIERKMIVEGKNEYVFENITPGQYTLRHTFGPVLWRGQLTGTELTGSSGRITVTDTLSDLGVGTKVLGQMEMQVIPGKDSGKLVVILRYDNP
ncbi:family 43 glycosylhydrolase [candidate division KSB1 bacterium]|nr:family 43 glycosylhydrolase [candidate division KSB1 bacterium]